nr:retrovirus-related Pol polyprotein from transposon TNT 1-94 [Tanacetum cinerariifolium]
REFSVARTPQQNGVAERKNNTPIEAARTMLADSKLLTTFWAEAVNTACYVQNRVLVSKPHNKTPYELFLGRKPAIIVSIEFCEIKGIRREFSVARTPQQNGVAERKNNTPIEAARTMLADSKLLTTFWAEAVNTACYVQNRMLVIKPHNKTPYELFLGRKPALSFMRPFGCLVTILNTLDHLGKFDEKSDDGFFVGYSINSKAFIVFNTRTRFVEENLHIIFFENKPNIAGNGPNWMFDIDTLTMSMNYQQVFAGNQTNGTASAKENIDAWQAGKKTVSGPQFVLLPLLNFNSQGTKSSEDEVADDAGKKSTKVPRKENRVQDPAKENDKNNQENDVRDQEEALRKQFKQEFERLFSQGEAVNTNSTDRLNTICLPVNTVSGDKRCGGEVDGTPVEDTVDTGIFSSAYDDEVEGAEADFNNLELTTIVSPIPTTRIHKDHPKEQIRGDPLSALQTKRMTMTSQEHAMMSSMGELTFFLGLQVMQKDDRIFISQDKYVADILNKFDFSPVKTSSTLIETNKALLKDEEAEDRIFRYLKGQPKLGLWYPRDSPFDLEAFLDRDYAGASLDRKSTTEGCQFLGNRLISWQCKKQTLVTNSTTKVEYVAAANCHGQGSGNIDKTPFMPHDLPLPRVNTLRSDEGRMKHNELMDLVTKLSDIVLALETNLKQTNKVYGAAYTKLIMKVKKLEKTIKTSQSRRKAKIVVSDKEVDLEDPSKQGRKIKEIDQDPDISLIQHDAYIQGRYEQYMEFDFDASNEVSTVEQVSTAGVAVTTASVDISPASPTRRVYTADDITMEETLVCIRRSVSNRKDKGKGIMEESKSAMTKTKRQQEQERLGHEATMRLQEEFDKEERQRIARVYEAAQTFTKEE